MDIAYGGNIYAILPASCVGLTISPKTASALIEAGNLIKDEVNSQVEICHPLIPFENKVTHIEFYEPAEAPGEPVRNAVVIPPGAIDRSPCGTGTSAKPVSYTHLTTAGTQEQQAASTDGEVKTITIFNSGGTVPEFKDPVASQIQEKTGFKMEYVDGAGAVEEKLNLMLSGQTYPDIVYLDSASPVSYTHLDVYKRQIISMMSL